MVLASVSLRSAVLSKPDVTPYEARQPMAVFDPPVLLENNALLPTATLYAAWPGTSISSIGPAPTPLLYKVLSPTATMFDRFVFFRNAFAPTATFEKPVVLSFNVLYPSAVLLLPVVLVPRTPWPMAQLKAPVVVFSMH